MAMPLWIFLDTQHCPKMDQKKKKKSMQEDGLDLHPIPIMPAYKGDFSYDK